LTNEQNIWYSIIQTIYCDSTCDTNSFNINRNYKVYEEVFAGKHGVNDIYKIYGCLWICLKTKWYGLVKISVIIANIWVIINIYLINFMKVLLFILK